MWAKRIPTLGPAGWKRGESLAWSSETPSQML